MKLSQHKIPILLNIFGHSVAKENGKTDRPVEENRQNNLHYRKQRPESLLEQILTQNTVNELIETQY